MKRLLPLLLVAAGCGGPLRETSLQGEYVRGAFHLYLFCPGGEHLYRAEDLLYPLNGAGQTWAVQQDGNDLVITWDGTPIANGRRTTEGLSLDFERIDPWADPVDWRFEGKIVDGLRYHDTTFAGRIVSGTRDGCHILPDSVAWFTSGMREPASELDPSRSTSADGAFGRFVWFLDIGPYAMYRKGDPGQRGRTLRMFSFAATGGGQVVADSDAAFFDNGFGTAWLGAARGRAVEFAQPQEYWSLDYRQDLLWDDGGSGDLGIHRVLSGFVGGQYRVAGENYPAGWDGETGMLPLKNPGMAFWLDLTRGENPDPDPPAVAPAVIARETEDGAPPLSPAIRLVDGVPVW